MSRLLEVGALDEHRRSILGVAMVSNDSRYVEGAFEQNGRFRPNGAAGEFDRLSDRATIISDEHY